MTVVFARSADYFDRVGSVLGSSAWLVIEQSRIDTFADTTGDHQWLHVDPVRAAGGPFGSTIAHGFLTLSLIPLFESEIYRVDGARMVINYGLNKVRFLAPVPVGSRLRGMTRLAEVTAIEGGVQPVYDTTIEIEGGDKPALVAQCIHRVTFSE